jgi:acyl-CoA thioester hydrolase
VKGELQIRVYYEDTDAAGIVYHANYLHFAERARTEALREAGLSHPELIGRYGCQFAVSRCGLEFRRPARLDDLLTVRTVLLRLSGARLELSQDVLRGSELLAAITVELALVDPRGRPQRIPEALASLFRSGEGADELA